MKHVMEVAAVLFLSLFLSLSVAVSGQGAQDLYKKAHSYTHVIYTETVLGERGHCSGTAIGPHALLTSSHCEQPVEQVTIDQIPHVTINELGRDDVDHTIMLVDITFDTWATVKQAEPEIGESVFIYGYPGPYSDILRKGYVATLQTPQDLFGNDDGPEEIVLDMNIFPGDSGAGVFNERGEVITTISTSETLNDDRPTGPGHSADTMKLVGCIKMNFNDKFLQQAIDYHKDDKHNAFTQGR